MVAFGDGFFLLRENFFFLGGGVWTIHSLPALFLSFFRVFFLFVSGD